MAAPLVRGTESRDGRASGRTLRRQLLTSPDTFYNICLFKRCAHAHSSPLPSGPMAAPAPGRVASARHGGQAFRIAPARPHNSRCPVHVTLRASALPVSLRSAGVFPAVRKALARASRAAFRVIVFSVQADHVHLVVEADAGRRLVRGLQGLAIRVAKAVNRVLGRCGTVWSDRYHARALTTPRAVRHALVYVLQNWAKHRSGVRGLDPCSSAAWFSGWRNRTLPSAGWSPVAVARTWLARWGWRRHGLLEESEAPRSPKMHRRRGHVAAGSCRSEPSPVHA